MTVWILLTLLLPTAPAPVPTAVVPNMSVEPVRYRGIERLLAKFEAEADEDEAARRRRSGRPSE